MKVVYLLLTLTCSGHTNAQCYPHVTVYQTKQECEAHLPSNDYFGSDHGVCFASVADPS